MNIFAQRMRELRHEKKKTQTQMAEFVGIKLRAYQNYELGASYPEVPNLMRLADYFGVTTDYLLGRSEER